MLTQKFQTLSLALVAAVGFAALGTSSHADIVFEDDFEFAITNAATYNVANTSQQIDTSKWVRTNTGAFASSRNGIVNENRTGENFSDPTGSQAWAGRYSSNTGVTSAAGVIGTLTAGQTITVTFDSVIDGYNNGSEINVLLVLFNDGADRDVVAAAGIDDTAAVLKRFTGTATSSYGQYSFSYTVGDAVDDNNGETAGVSTAWLDSLLGKDIAVRFNHKNDALVDNVSVSIIPEPASLALLGLGALMMLPRRKGA